MHASSTQECVCETSDEFSEGGFAHTDQAARKAAPFARGMCSLVEDPQYWCTPCAFWTRTPAVQPETSSAVCPHSATARSQPKIGGWLLLPWRTALVTSITQCACSFRRNQPTSSALPWADRTVSWPFAVCERSCRRRGLQIQLPAQWVPQSVGEGGWDTPSGWCAAELHAVDPCRELR